MRIDAHTHVLPPDYLQTLVNRGRYETDRGAEGQLIIKERGSRFLTVTPQLTDLAQRAAEMDAAGIDLQIISLGAPNVYFLEGDEAAALARDANDYLAAIVREYPERFRALANVPLTADIDAAIREYDRCMDELGMVGVLVGSNINGLPIDHPGFDPFYEEVNRRGGTLFIHPMVPAGFEVMNQYALAPLVGFMSDVTLAVSRLIFSNFFGRFLGVNVLVAGLGGAIPYLAGRLDAGYRAYPECQGISRAPSEFIEHLYLDTVSFHEAAVRCAVDTVGADHLVFGSDYPHVIGDVPTAIQSVEGSVRRGLRGAILGDTAAKLFGIEKR